ncbi:MAG TPA: sigma factor, partial [Ktedonobacterales bacterium]|nr:sigma factor [Ktedonobacterales bacterium]
MEPSLNAQRTHEISDPAMRPILDWIESYAVWTSLPPYTRASIIKRAQKGEEAAREAMINHNMRLVLSRATKKVGLGVPLPDLIQEGWLGLREAVTKYEPKRGTKFSTMAVNWIDQKLGRALVTQ